MKTNKTRKTNKSGISLIVLVITIIVMIILAAAIVITLNNSGIISKANTAVDVTNLANVQDLAAMLWAEAYADGAREQTELETAVLYGLKAAKVDTTKYTVTVTELGVTVSRAGASNVPTEWAENVVDIVDGVPIPKGFVASPYGADEANGILAENTKAGGLVIYELAAGETAIPSDETQFESWTTRNQYVWVPVDKDNFITEFVRKDYINETSKVVDTNGSYNALGTSNVYWEVIVDGVTNLPLTTIAEQSETYMSEATLAEVQAMYASVKEYGGFYIARYEAGTSNERTYLNAYDEDSNVILEDAVYSMMNKYPYNYIGWNSSNTMNEDEGGVVEVARSMYPSTNTKYGVVSTLTYGVQWDRTVQWYIDTGAMTLDEVNKTTGSAAYGNYNDHNVTSYTELNEGAKYGEGYVESYAEVTADYTKTNSSHLYTTGALKSAKVNNIYDMAGNVDEWTMEGYSTSSRIFRGGSYYNTGSNDPVSYRNTFFPSYACGNYGFRPSLYIKK